jgi:hypothetical protein
MKEIEIKPYDYTCGDGCCYQSGYDVFIDGEHIGFTIAEYAEEVIDIINEHLKEKRNEDNT